METHPDPDLEAALHRELRQLPPLRAPETLAPRVMAVLRARAARPWWQLPWLMWPRAWQTASVVVAAAVLALAIWAERLLWDRAAGGSVGEVSSWQSYASFSALWDTGSTLAGTLGTWVGASPWIWAGAVGAVAALYLFCVGLGTMCFRVATNRV